MSLCHRHQSTECGIEDNQEEECFLAYLDNEVSTVAYIQGELIIGNYYLTLYFSYCLMTTLFLVKIFVMHIWTLQIPIFPTH